MEMLWECLYQPFTMREYAWKNTCSQTISLINGYPCFYHGSVAKHIYMLKPTFSHGYINPNFRDLILLGSAVWTKWICNHSWGYIWLYPKHEGQNSMIIFMAYIWLYMAISHVYSYPYLYSPIFFIVKSPFSHTSPIQIHTTLPLLHHDHR